MRTLFLTIPLLAATVVAQNYAVSPAYCAGSEGGSNNTIPFWGLTGFYRYQQPTSDLKGTPKLFTEIAWRRDGNLSAATSYAARTIDMEISLADADLATFSSTFATNYANPPVNVFTRKMVNTPDHTNQPPVLPAPWTFACLFDVPFVYIGTKDLLYDITCYSFSSPDSFPLDAVSGATPSAVGGFSVNGTGCTTSNGQMALRSSFSVNSTLNTISLSWNVARAPSSAASATLVGLADPNLPIPGLCGSGFLHTDALLLAIAGTTASTGTLLNPAIMLPTYDPAWQALTLTAQTVSVDASQPGLPVAVSNGIASPIPPMPTPTLTHRLFSDVVSPAGSLGRGFGLVTRFRY